MRLEEVAVWRVVHNYDVFDWSAQSCQILHVKVSLVLGAMLSIQKEVNKFAFGVQFLKQGISISGQGRRKHHDLIMRGNSFEKFIAGRTFAGEHLLVHHLVGQIRNVDCESDVCVGHWFELRVD